MFTHNSNGEYGHIRHIEVHEAVNEMLNKKLLSAKKLFFFSYFKEKNGICNVNKNADKLIRLKDAYFKMKKHLIQEIYGFQEDSFEAKSCRDTEEFDIKNN